MKTCSCCNQEKPESDFQVRKASKDGLTASCKACLKIRDKNRDSEERRAARREYQKTETGKLAHKRALESYKKRHPMKYAAHLITGNYIRDGRIKKESNCSVCGSGKKVEAHHDDYTKPIDVRFLCECCHKEWHRNNKAIYE